MKSDVIIPTGACLATICVSIAPLAPFTPIGLFCYIAAAFFFSVLIIGVFISIKEKQREASRKATLDRERAERKLAERAAAEADEKAKIREMFNKFMAEERKATVDDVDRMFEEWKNNRKEMKE